MKTIALAIITLIASALSDSTSSLSSQMADYDGTTLQLQGEVLLDHGLGKMRAEEASLQRQEGGKEFPFSLIHLKKEVLLNLTSGSSLQCERADLDFVALKGHLFSSDTKKVVYSTPLKQKQQKRAGSMRLMSQEAELGIVKKGHDGKKSSFEVSTIIAKSDVIVDYENAFTLRADHAIYQAAQTAKESATIVAYPNAEGSIKCLLTHEADSIVSDLASLDLAALRLSLHQPIGSIHLSLSHHLPQTAVHFHANQLIWHHPKETLHLKGAVSIHEASLGQIDCDDELILTEQQSKNKRLFKSLKAIGHTTLTYTDPALGKKQKLITQGQLSLHHDQLIAIVESPLSESRVTAEDQQMYYEEEEFAVFANRAALEYEASGSVLRPVSITLKGHVRLFTHDSKHPPLCGLADRVSYSPLTRTLILSADAPKKVLFWDEEQGMRLAAPEIHVTQDPQHKRSIKGIGAVRLSFTTEEESLLQKLFSFYKVLP